MTVIKCDLCGSDKDVEFTLTSKHLLSWCRVNLLISNPETRLHITRHICVRCFSKLFGDEK